MRCAGCNVAIDRETGYIEVRVTANRASGGNHVTMAYCTWFCGAMALDRSSLAALESTPMMTQLPQCKMWIETHQEF